MNRAKEAAARRERMAAELSAAFDAMGDRYSCSASVTSNVALQALAYRLAVDALADGLPFGNSRSKHDPRHVAGLALSDADRLQSAKYRANNPGRGTI
jgi:hypothetical protein